MAKQIPLNQILPALDRKDRDFYDNLSAEEQKAFSGFLMLRYISSIGPDWRGKNDPGPALTEYYLMSTNLNANINMFAFNKHPKLQWLMLTAASPKMGEQFHSWIKQKPKLKSSDAPIKKQLAIYFPTMKEDDLEVLSKIVTKKELKEYNKAHGDNG